jgi:Transposase IS66 family
MPTTPLCQSWPRAKPGPADCGPMSATIGPLPAEGRRRPYSSIRAIVAEYPEQHLACFAGLMQADAYAGFNRLYEAGRKPEPVIEPACWAHARRKLFDLARINKAPIASEGVKGIDALFAIEREIN